MKKIHISSVLVLLSLVFSLASTLCFMRSMWVHGQPYTDADHVFQTVAVQFGCLGWLLALAWLVAVGVARLRRRQS